MFRLSRKTIFAIEAVLDIAYNSGPSLVQSREITKRQGIPKRYLEQVLQNLVKANILSGVRGPKGVYRLARERRRISVGEVTRVVLEMESYNHSLGKNQISLLSAEVVEPVLDKVSFKSMELLDQISIQDLCNLARERGIDRNSADRLDFTI